MLVVIHLIKIANRMIKNHIFSRNSQRQSEAEEVEAEWDRAQTCADQEAISREERH